LEWVQLSRSGFAFWRKQLLDDPLFRGVSRARFICFHPEASRLARMASGGRYGFAQSLFQVGGNAGQSLGPLLAALVVGTRGQGKIAWFSVVALLGIFVLFNAGRWYQQNLFRLKA